MRRLLITCFLLLSIPALAATSVKPQSGLKVLLQVVQNGPFEFCAFVYSQDAVDSDHTETHFILTPGVTAQDNEGQCTAPTVESTWQLLKTQRLESAATLSRLHVVVQYQAGNDTFRSVAYWSNEPVDATPIGHARELVIRSPVPPTPGVHLIRIGATP